MGVAAVGEFLDIVEVVEDEQGLLQPRCSRLARRAGEEIDQRLDVVATEHRAEQFGRREWRDQRAGLFAPGHAGEELGLDLGRIVDAGRNPVGDQLEQCLLFTRRRVVQQSDEFLGLSGGQRQRRNAKRSALGNVGTVGFQHGDVLSR
ncbi:MAG: hypothetical protein AW08_02325 [Candidatus Accumulibacter adjunctus]|uniref:Uncharacterized protein n=1 Tax=Candidatus Accumulibacter adjunctus TaxID=1454001 RepID=A0A011NQ35_9PROT|nr:MAG: hypothetical protein AW08_02325 [Candidatus Accumulibacter adjunctus]